MSWAILSYLPSNESSPGEHGVFSNTCLPNLFFSNASSHLLFSLTPPPPPHLALPSLERPGAEIMPQSVSPRVLLLGQWTQQLQLAPPVHVNSAFGVEERERDFFDFQSW